MCLINDHNMLSGALNSLCGRSIKADVIWLIIKKKKAISLMARYDADMVARETSDAAAKLMYHCSHLSPSLHLLPSDSWPLVCQEISWLRMVASVGLRGSDRPEWI